MSVPSNETIMNAVSLADDAESDVFNIKGLKYFALQFIITGTPVGTLSIKVSNDSSDDSYFQEITDGSIAVSGAAVECFEALSAFDYVKVFYTSDSSTGAVTCIASSKE